MNTYFNFCEAEISFYLFIICFIYLLNNLFKGDNDEKRYCIQKYI